MFICSQCPRKCHAARSDQGAGFCHMPENPVLARAALHFDEEPCISGTRGSGTVFFSGCALGCVFCQNEAISHGGVGRETSVDGLRRCFSDLVRQGAHNINLVNPTHYLHAVLQAMDAPLPVPVVWNSGGYELASEIARLLGVVQVYLPDLKYMDAESAKRYSGAEAYFRHASEALREMHRQQPEVVLDADGVIQRGLIVRHLILPGRAEESKRILAWIQRELPGAWVSLMAQYTPLGRASEYPEIDRRLTEEEYEAVVEHMLDLGLEDGYVQELGSADERYVPPFDLTGV